MNLEIEGKSAMSAMWSQIRGVPAVTFLICFAAYGLSQLDMALFSYALPVMRRELDLTLTTVGIVVGVAYTVGGTFQLLMGHLTDRFGRSTMLQLALGVASVAVAAHALVLGPVSLTIARTVTVFSGGALYPATGALVTETAPARYRGLMAGLLQTAYPLGWFAAAMFAAPFLTLFGWRALFAVALLSLPFIFVVRRYLKESARFAVAKAQTEKRSLSSSFGALFAPNMIRRTITLFIAQFLFVVAYGGSSLLFPTYFVEARGVEIGSSAILVGLGNGVGLFGYILAAYVGEFVLSRRNTVVLWTLLGATAFFGLIWGTSSYSSALAAFAVMSFFFYGASAVKFAYVAEVFPTHLRATGLAFCSSLAVNIGIAIGPLSVSAAVEAYGWDIAFSALVGVPLITAGIFYLFLTPVPSGIDVDQVQEHFGGKGD
ncbi:MAG: MFS transporter [Rhodobacteraceae bacterium]|nr:MFS transporter [Paracoccaceae bacterium]